MELKPTMPPGRKTRKARAFATEIQRLAGLGYSMNAIRDALKSAGVTVSKTTVIREVHREHDGITRHATAAPNLPTARHPVYPETATATATAAASAPPAAPLPPQRFGKATAEAFFDANPSNPLL